MFCNVSKLVFISVTKMLIFVYSFGLQGPCPSPSLALVKKCMIKETSIITRIIPLYPHRGFIVILASYFRNHALFFPRFHVFSPFSLPPPKTPYFPTGPASLLVVIRGFPPTIITITAWEPSFLVRFFCCFFHVKVVAYVLYTFTKNYY